MAVTLVNPLPEARSQPNALVRVLGQEQSRWFLWVPVFFAAGIAVYFALPVEPALASALAPAAGALVLRAIWRRGLGGALVTGALVSLALGMALAKVRTEVVRAPILARDLNAVSVSGFVLHAARREKGGPRVTLLVTSLSTLPQPAWPKKVRISLLKAPESKLVPGAHVSLKASLRPPPRPALPGGFDFARMAYFRQLGAVGFSWDQPKVTPSSTAAPFQVRLSASVQALRQWIGERVLAHLPGQTGALATALITGERGAIPEEINQAFRDSGLLHILSISGLHMAVMAGFVFFVVRWVLALFPALALRFAIKKWAAVAAIIAALGYLMISGGALATVRSFVMVLVAFFAVIVDRPAIALRNVALAALVILAVMPESLLNPGFQMSFAAVAALVAAYEAFRDRRRGQGRDVVRGTIMSGVLVVGGVVATTIIAGLAVAPIAIFHFHRSQQFAVLANLIGVPLTNFVLMPAALLTLLALPFGLEAVPLAVMGRSIDVLVWTAKSVAALPGAVVPVPAIPSVAFGLVVCGGLWLFIWRRRWRLLGLAAIAGGIAVAPLRGAPDVLIGADGKLVAFRDQHGRLTAMGRGGTFSLSRWLQADGDPRSVKAARAGNAKRCERVGCVATTANGVIALSRHPSGLADDCQVAQVLVLTYTRPKICHRVPTVIDWRRLRDHGNHVLTFEASGKPGHGKTARVTAVDVVRGARPWVLTPAQRRAHRRLRKAQRRRQDRAADRSPQKHRRRPVPRQ